MKKSIHFFAISFLLLIGQSINAQEKFTTYDNSYAAKTYDIQISTKESGGYKLYIDAMSMDKLNKEGGIMVKENQLPDFITALNEAKAKYEEWVKTAKENNVKDLDKRMTIKSKVGGYFLYGDWNFQFVVYLDFDFKIIESKGETKYMLIVRTGELQSSSNQFMKVDGFVLVFQDSKEIDAFTAAISPQKVADFMNKPKAKDLFKD